MEEFGIDHLKKIVKESIEAGMSWGKALEDGKVSIGEWIGSGKESVDVIIALKDYKLIVKEALNISPEETKELSDYVLDNVKGLEEEEEASKWIKDHKALSKIPSIILVTAYGREEIMQQA